MVGTILYSVGFLMAVGGAVWLFIVALQEHPSWLFLCMCVPLAAFVFAFKYPHKAGRPFGICLMGSALEIVGAALKAGPPPFMP